MFYSVDKSIIQLQVSEVIPTSVYPVTAGFSTVYWGGTTLTTLAYSVCNSML